ncbi:MAG: tRNA-uridine aminocarboxypropyltransferase [Planctomycetota bacterium]
MGRSVVLAGAARCPRCSLPPRWCTCDMLPPVETRLTVQVLIHRLEQCRPSSTGKLVGRAVTGAICHVYQRGNRFFPATGYPADAVEHGRELWVLHPSGDPLPERAAADGSMPQPRPAVVLLDGSWRQAGEMLASMQGLGRCVRLPAAATSEPSRYWLRDQAKPEQLCTAEALIGVLTAGGEPEAARQLWLHFELHVYATLLVRGHRELAERYLGHSPLIAEAPDALDRLHARRGT